MLGTGAECIKTELEREVNLFKVFDQIRFVVGLASNREWAILITEPGDRVDWSYSEEGLLRVESIVGSTVFMYCAS